MITLSEYVGIHDASVDWTPDRRENAKRLLLACNALIVDLKQEGILFHKNPATGSLISGQTFGGFRPQSCTVGAPRSSHKSGYAVDIFDPHADIDEWLLTHPFLLEEHGIYIEHPDKTPGWSHWSIKPPASGRHIFFP